MHIHDHRVAVVSSPFSPLAKLGIAWAGFSICVALYLIVHHFLFFLTALDLLQNSCQNSSRCQYINTFLGHHTKVGALRYLCYSV